MEVTVEQLFSCNKPLTASLHARKQITLPGIPSVGDNIYLSADGIDFQVMFVQWRENDSVLLRLKHKYPPFDDLDSLKRVEDMLIDRRWEIEIV